MSTATVFDGRAIAAVTRQTLALREQAHPGQSVAVVYGPVSAEDQLYLAKSPKDQLSVTALTETLTALGHHCEVLDPCDPGFVQALTRFDVVLSNQHGAFGEDGRLQGLLDYLRVPYCGNGVAASAVAADKILCKRLMESLGVPTPDWQVWPDGEITWTGSPVMVKPSLGGSSVGMSLVREETDLPQALAEASDTDHAPVLVEEYVEGTPVTVGLLELPEGVVVFPPLATEVHTGDFYDADTKLDVAGQNPVTVVAAELPEAVLTSLTSYARALWEGLGCRGTARADFVVTTDGQVFALEVNTNPGMSKGANFIAGAALCGLSHADVVLAVLHEALTRPAYDVPLPSPVFTS